MTLTETPPTSLDDARHTEIDAMVATSAEAARRFRELDQEQVDAIVDAMVRAGVRAAAELAQVAIEETGFGVFEDKVVKNYVATEFLSDYLRDKKSVGVIDEDVERNIVHVAEPIGVVLAITPVTNPTSTVLYKAIVAAKTRNAVLFRPSPYAIRCCERAVEILREAAEAAGMPPGALQVIPDAAHEVTHYLFKHPDVDFIWVTGGPKIVALANAAGKPGLSVGPGNAPIYLHRTADVRGAVVDILISKTFDASVICPAEQTCIVDDAVYDEVLAEFRADGRTPAHRGRGRPAHGVRVRLRGRRHQQGEHGGARAAGAAAGRPGRHHRRPGDQDAARPAADRPRAARGPPAGAGEADAGARPGPLAQRRARRRRGRPGHRARRPRAHLRGVRQRPGGRRRLREGGAHRADPGQRADRGRARWAGSTTT